ncbi:protein peste isoform X1 [Papilio machaon]|uniref:protein peste isoform X1 n=1 Tax=Papilio machaon TaxID=76193 RepID=UPI001E665896|nr:protein peste isoform X1 [Papilio machaon]
MRGRPPRGRLAVGATAALLAAAALGAALAWNQIFDAALSAQMVMSPTSRTFREWVEPTIPLYFDVYLFNWTNADQFPEEIPNLQEVGPYRFREQRRHVNVSWHPHNGSVSYRTQRSWHFDETSNGTLEDNITTLNIIAASAVYRSRDWGFLRQKGLAMGLAMFGHHVSISKLATELLFEGYDDPLLDLAKNLPASATGGAPPVDKFGLFYGRNNSLDTDGYMEVSTGAGGAAGSLPGQILKWNYEDHLPFYSGQCSKLSGSAGEFMRRDLSEQSGLELFLPDLCRTVLLEHTGSGVHDSLAYNKYELTESSFDNSSSSPENSCFCNGECAWGGVMNVSSCRYGSPSFLSLPHFLHGDPRLLELVTGLEPDPDKHSFYFAVEPKLGVPLEVSARFQLNIWIEPTQNIELFEKVPKMLFPIFWVEQKVYVEERVLSELRIVRAILDWGGAVCAGVTLFFTVLAVKVLCCKKKQKYSRIHRDTNETRNLKPKSARSVTQRKSKNFRRRKISHLKK